jgi:hypothetical protein
MSTGSITITPGKVFNVITGERVDLPKLNLLGTPTARVDENSIGRRELITAFVEQVDDATSGLANEIIVRAAADLALAQSITTLDVRLTSAEGGISGNASAISSLDTRVTSAEGTISSQATAIERKSVGQRTSV